MIIQKLLTRPQSPGKVAGEVRQRPQGGAELGGIMGKPWPHLPLLLDMIENVIQAFKALPKVLDLFAELEILLICRALAWWSSFSESWRLPPKLTCRLGFREALLIYVSD